VCSDSGTHRSAPIKRDKKFNHDDTAGTKQRRVGDRLGAWFKFSGKVANNSCLNFSTGWGKMPWQPVWGNKIRYWQLQ